MCFVFQILTLTHEVFPFFQRIKIFVYIFIRNSFLLNIHKLFFFFFLLFFSTGWYEASGTNICYVAYTYAKRVTNKKNLVMHLREMVLSKRIDFTAKHSCYFIEKIKAKCGNWCAQNIRDMTVAGYSLGAHIAAMTSRCLSQRTGQKFGKIIGNFPFKISVIIQL